MCNHFHPCNFNKKMNQIIDILCPGTSIETIQEHSGLVTHYLSTRPKKLSMFVDQKYDCLECPICKNTNDSNFVNDNTSGDTICLGVDNLGCGGIVTERHSCITTEDTYQSVNPYFSEQRNFESNLIKCGRKIRKLNTTVERNLNKYNSDSLCTSEIFKDGQRKYVYDLLDNIKENTTVDVDVIEEVKAMYNLYRSVMTRIHKLHLTLASMFYVIM